MFFPQMLSSDTDREALKKICEAYSVYVDDCVGCLVNAYTVAESAASKTDENHHITILLLARHVIESLDAVSAMVSRGCSHPCQTALRSALEGVFGVLHILQADTVRRARAYQVAHAHRRIKLYEKADPSTDAGREWRRVLSTDPVGDVLSTLPAIDYTKAIANLRSMLARPDFVPIEQEWHLLREYHIDPTDSTKKTKKKSKSDPEWYSLFGGPANLRDLAIKVGHPALYEFLYRQWSNEVHAGAALDAVGRKGGATVVRPVRHPEMLQTCVIFAGQFSLMLSRRLIEFYDAGKLVEFRARYINTIQSRLKELMTKKVVTAPWKDTLPH